MPSFTEAMFHTLGRCATTAKRSGADQHQDSRKYWKAWWPAIA
jgi:hypothetical protein